MEKEIKEIIERLEKKGYISEKTAKETIETFTSNRFSTEILFSTIKVSLEEGITESLQGYQRLGIDEISLSGISYHLWKAYFRFIREIPENKKTVLLNLERFYDTVDKEAEISISIVLDPGVTERVVDFVRKKLIIKTFPWKVNIKSVYAYSPTRKMRKEKDKLKDILEKFNIKTFSRWKEFLKNAGELIIYGVELPLPDPETMKKRWFKLLEKGKSISTSFLLIDFFKETDWQKLKEILKKNPVLFTAAGNVVGYYAPPEEIDMLKRNLEIINRLIY